MAHHSEPGVPVAKRAFRPGRREFALASLVVLAAIGVAVALLTRSSAAVKIPGTTATAVHTSRYEGLAVSPTSPAPALALRNYLGVPVNIDAYRGKAVLVT